MLRSCTAYVLIGVGGGGLAAQTANQARAQTSTQTADQAITRPAARQENAHERALRLRPSERRIQLGPRPFYLIDQMPPGALKSKLQACADGPFRRTDFSIGHRGAALQFPEHTEQSYRAAARMGAGIIECDVTFTKDKQLVCRHSQCDLHQTTNILATPLAAKCSTPFSPADRARGRKAQAKCCTSDLTLAEFQTLRGKMDGANKKARSLKEYMRGAPRWRTELYAGTGKLMTLREAITLFKALGVKHTPELKGPLVKMPYKGAYTQHDFSDAMIAAYRGAGVDAKDVFVQSFNLDDIDYWLARAPDFGAQAVFLDGRYRSNGFDPQNSATWSPSMPDLAKRGLRYIAPPMWVLVALNDKGEIVPSAYAVAARAAGLKLITWTIERSGPLHKGGGWYYRTIKKAITNDGDMMTLIDVLARQVKVTGIFSDWPATVTYYANCINGR